MVEPGEAQDDVDLLEGLLDDVHARLQGRRCVSPRDGRPLEAVEVGAEQIDDPGVGGVAGDRDHDPRRHVLLAEVAQDDVAAVAGHRLARAEDRAPQGVPLPDLGGEQVVDQVVGGVLHHLDLLQDHRLLTLELLGVEDGVQQDVGEEVHGERQVLVEDLHVEARVLLGREGVHLPADRIHRARDLLGGARSRALEDQVLDEVGHPAATLGLVS